MSLDLKWLLGLVLIGMSLMARADDPTTFPADGMIRIMQIPAYTFAFSDVTNCYIISNKAGETLIIDPLDSLQPVTDPQTGQAVHKILADAQTGEGTLIDAEKLEAYRVSKTNAYGEPTVVQDPGTGHDKYVYDQFRTTNTYGPQIMQLLKEHKLRLKLIVVTHGHLDHFGAITYLQEKTGARVLMHKSDLRALNGSKLDWQQQPPPVGYPKDSYRILGLRTPVDQPLADGDTITLGDMVFQVINTPGHSPGSICLRTRQGKQTILFSGDTLLHWGYLRDALGNQAFDEKGKPLTSDTGRTNFIDGSGDETALNNSIRDKLYVLPDSTIVYPGHYESTTIGEEKANGPQRPKPGANGEDVVRVPDDRRS